MKKIAKTALLACLMSMLTFNSSAEERDVRTITVAGQAERQTVPNAFELSVTVEEKGPVVSKLNNALQKRLESMVSFLLSQGISEGAIQTLQVNLFPNYQSSPQGRRQNGVVLSRELRIQGLEIDKYDQIIDGLLTRGIDRINQFSFYSTQAEALRTQALKEAVSDAEQKASMIAEQLNQDIIGVYSVLEQGASAPNPYAAMRMMAESSTGTMPGSMTVSASVQVSFLLAPRINK